MRQSSIKGTVLYLRVDHGGEYLDAGGSVAHTLGVIKGFISNNWSMVCASSSAFNTIQKTFEHIPVYGLRMPLLLRPLRWKLNCILSNIFFTWRIIRICSFHSDITHVYQRHSPFCMVGMLVARWLKVPLILEYNGSEVWMARHWNIPSLFSLRWLLHCFETNILRSATYIVVVSPVSISQLQQENNTSAQIIVRPNGVDVEEFDPIVLHDDRVRIRYQYGLTNRFVFGFIGTFSPWHGIQQLAKIIPAIAAREPRAAFLLIGDGQLKPWLYDQLTLCGMPMDNVIFTGKVAQHEGKKYLAACDAFMLPTQPNTDGSPFFGSPIKLFEYMSMAKPIIASDITPISQILATIGILVHPHDTDGFIDAACSLMNRDSGELLHLGAAARASVTAHYTWHEHVKVIIHAIQQGIEGRI